MHVNPGIVGVLLLWWSGGSGTGADSAPPSPITIELRESTLAVRARRPEGPDLFDLATYVCAPGRRPYLHPVYDPSGKVALTQDRPEDHPWQHGIFTGFHRVNGVNYWKEDEGRQRLVRVRDVQQGREWVGWRAIVEWVSPQGEVVIEEENRIVIHAPESVDSYRIDFTIVLRARERDVQFGKFFVGGLAVRMPWDQANPRQTHLNSTGLRNRAGEQQRAAWCTVERPLGESTFGMAIFDHPRNTNHPPVWRVDEQGLINPNISGLSDWSIPAGEERRFAYQIMVFRGAATEERMIRAFARFAGLAKEREGYSIK